ncbi:enoyl-CoA hydratase/isomerase family protein [Moraxella catarrhalis]|uniref:Methylglutaconyl-CoA hydratase n=1 Tax=Moraxella catarrhalis TaxID=480 RepID=A0A198UJ04_MORCA|nr:enoyl-CoA hydratase/isomerase family protein [Moraxella catarrhalis]OAU96366.1 Methylglutaconyl-CoA hydratase [Moraxella catarrhalis]OAU97185.1 Methylglutaconyl-CoA hydratase [Moraxella catarrhalis]OAU99729.1 Methylglutaconyl-CoA hydratase [Moraxella catarrhalis]
MSYDYLHIEKSNQVATVWLNRPEVHNAFNEGVISELQRAFEDLGADDEVRVVMLAGRGKSFSAGADLNWMKKAGEADLDENIADAERLAKMLQTLATLPKPTIARVHGAALGGGMGLASTCDICIASTEAKFATSEVRLGLAPSTISPYVIRAIGERQARRYFLTAERIDAQTAYHIGLAHEVCEVDELDATVDKIIQAILQGAPNAQADSKTLIDMVAKKAVDEALLTETAKHIATIRQGSEAKEGLQAFLNKRSPAWIAK